MHQRPTVTTPLASRPVSVGQAIRSSTDLLVGILRRMLGPRRERVGSFAKRNWASADRDATRRDSGCLERGSALSLRCLSVTAALLWLLWAGVSPTFAAVASGNNSGWYGPLILGVPQFSEAQGFLNDIFAPLNPACPTANQCTLMDDSGNAVTFDPQSSASRTTLALGVDSPASLSCATQKECVVVGGLGIHPGPTPADSGLAVTFDPMSSRITESTRLTSVESGLASVSCPAIDECVATSHDGAGVYVFDPGTSSTRTLTLQDNSGATPDVVDCPTVTECVGLTGGAAVTFNPQDGQTIAVNEGPPEMQASLPS